MHDDNKTLVDEFLRHDRVVIEASLELANGSFFQPTGFPDIDACVFVDKDGRRRCLVESEQSMANRLEAVCMQAPGTWRPPFEKKLPVIRIVDGNGDLLGTNLTEPHRLSSTYVLEGTRDGNSNLQEILREKLGVSTDGKRWPLDKRAAISRVVFALDPAAVLHGFQFMQWSAVGLRQQRLLHARMEAVLAGDSDVHYGVVKVDSIDPGGHKEKSNIGQSIAHKARLVPESIIATFEIDVLGLRERWLVDDKPEPPEKNEKPEKKKQREDALAQNAKAQSFLLALALWKIRQFLADQPSFDARTGQVDRALRLRSDCGLKLMDPNNGQQRHPLQYRTQSNGATFDEAVELTPTQLVKVEQGQVGPLVKPPDFKPLVKTIAGTEDIEIQVTWGKPATEEKEPAAVGADDGNGDKVDGDDDAGE